VRRFIAIVLIFSLGVALASTYFTRPSDIPSASVIPGNCSTRDLIAIEQGITSQTESLSAQDFQEALTYSSDSFRSRISESQFARIISVGYSFLLENPSITLESCDQNAAGQITVSASFETGSDVVRLTYAMTNERNGWFIDSASRPGNNQLTV
jgi:type 1 fimbria pilin